jgi:cob(I)alamin adenosyltransferase
VLLVSTAVGELEQTAASSLVEVASAEVLLEDPESEAFGALLLDDVEECAPDTEPLLRRLHVELGELVVRKGRKADDPPSALGDPDLSLRDDTREVDAVLIGRVQRRQKRQRLEGAPEHVRHSVGVVCVRSSEHAPIVLPVRKRDEPVRLTRIYTGGGDLGETSLGDGSRTSKLDERITAFGAVDELNASLGLVLGPRCPDDVRDVLGRVQNELFDLGADLSVPLEREGRLRVTQEQVDALERDCDAFNATLPELRSFVLPGGDEVAARLHVSRTICRRAEREALAAARAYELNPVALVYLNRLSDLLFILARAVNAAAGHEEPMWKPGSSR